MDYSYDSCYTEFTRDQATRAHAHVDGLPHLLTHAAEPVRDVIRLVGVDPPDV